MAAIIVPSQKKEAPKSLESNLEMLFKRRGNLSSETQAVDQALKEHRDLLKHYELESKRLAEITQKVSEQLHHIHQESTKALTESEASQKLLTENILLQLELNKSILTLSEELTSESLYKKFVGKSKTDLTTNSSMLFEIFLESMDDLPEIIEFKKNHTSLLNKHIQTLAELKKQKPELDTLTKQQEDNINTLRIEEERLKMENEKLSRNSSGTRKLHAETQSKIEKLKKEKEHLSHSTRDALHEIEQLQMEIHATKISCGEVEALPIVEELDDTVLAFVKAMVTDLNNNHAPANLIECLQKICSPKTRLEGFSTLVKEGNTNKDATYHSCMFLLSDELPQYSIDAYSEKMTLAILKMAAEQGHPYAQMALASHYEEDNPDLCLKYYEIATQQEKYLLPYCMYGMHLYTEDTMASKISLLFNKAKAIMPMVHFFFCRYPDNNDNKIFIENLKQGAEKGDPACIDKLASYYYYIRDNDQFVFWAKQAPLTTGTGLVLKAVTCTITTSEGPRNIPLAVEYFFQAIVMGQDCMIDIQYYAKHHSDPEVQKKITEGVSKFRQGVLAGDRNQIYALAFCYEHGISVSQDKWRAYSLYTQASKLIHSEATHKILALPKNCPFAITSPQQRLKLLKIVATNGDETTEKHLLKSCLTGIEKELDRVSKIFSPDDMTKLNQIIAEFAYDPACLDIIPHCFQQDPTREPELPLTEKHRIFLPAFVAIQKTKKDAEGLGTLVKGYLGYPYTLPVDPEISEDTHIRKMDH